MKTVVKKLYEAMFLVNSAEASSDWSGVESAIKKILDKAGAEIVSLGKWDERELAYKIGGHSRGTYILCYFRCDSQKLQEIERDVQLSERIMRVLILCAELMSKEDIEKETPAMRAGKHEDVKASALDAEEKQLSEKSSVVDAVDEVDEMESRIEELEGLAGFSDEVDEVEPETSEE